mgnify:CR=1 FL=1
MTLKDFIFNFLTNKDMTKDKKRIELHKMTKGKNAFEKKYVQLFLQLLEYIDQVR